jgi:O-6-methylguanine DNA methyltransferase
VERRIRDGAASLGRDASNPFGETRTYAELAGNLRLPGGAAAVRRASGRNRVALLIPCHRMVGSDGELTGYGGGIWRKRRLLEIERAAGRAAIR